MVARMSSLHKARAQSELKLPKILQDLSSLCFRKIPVRMPEDPKLCEIFSDFIDCPILHAIEGRRQAFSKLKVGVVLSGGQASGGHNVIAGLFDALKKMDLSSELIGFLGGPSGIIEGQMRTITQDLLASYRNQGGFDLLGSGRTKIESEEQLSKALETIKALSLDGLVVVGGDDSNTNACVLAKYLKEHACQTTVVGVPKTIDGDLQNDSVAISFGFDSACRVYSEMIGNIARDAISAKKYYHFIRLMGRSASHVTLECALSTQVNYTIILEEVFEKKLTLSQIISDICDMICKRAEMNKHFGVILLPEGLLEFIDEVSILIKELNRILTEHHLPQIQQVLPLLSEPSRACMLSLPESIQKQLLLSRDPHGNVQVSLIETERLISEAVDKELQARKSKGLYMGKFNPINHFFGYEGRAGLPTNFDAHYCYALGMAAALLVDEKASGYMGFVSGLTSPVSEWSIGGVPLLSLMNREERHGKDKPVIKKVLCNLNGRPFLKFASQREDWKYSDDYVFPGPIQYFGPEEVSFVAPLTLTLK